MNDLPDFSALTTTDCGQPIWLNILLWVVGGGVLTTVFQFLNERMNLNQLKESYKTLYEENEKQKGTINLLANQKDFLWDSIKIIDSKIQLYNKLLSSSKIDDQDACVSCLALTSELNSVIEQVNNILPDDNSIIRNKKSDYNHAIE